MAAAHTSGETSRCACCGGVFESDRSDADAMMEYQDTFTEEQRARPGEPAVVCDDCYRQMMAAKPPAMF